MSLSPTRMKKLQLKETLIARGYSSGEIDGLKRPQLLELFSSESKGNEALTALVQVTECKDEIIVKQNVATSLDNKSPTPSDKGWTQYVIGKFDEEEMEGENPRLEGLRRVAEELIGVIIEEGCDLISSPHVENGMRACAKAWIIFETPDGRKRVEALADACSDNVGEDFAIYLTAMADTRAKGRCFRNALKLRRVVSAEEINKKVGFGSDEPNSDAIHMGQITMIRMLANRLEVSIPKLLDDLELNYKKTEAGVVDLKSLTHEDALMSIKRLNDLRQTKVPDKLKRGSNG